MESNTSETIHNTVPSSSQQTTIKDGKHEGTSGGSDRLPKTKSQSMMESHSVDAHLLKELRFAKFIAKCPCLLCVIVLAVLFMLTSMAAQVAPLDAGEIIEFSSRAATVNNNRYTIEDDAYNLAADFVHSRNGSTNATTPQTSHDATFFYYFTDKNYDDDMSSSTNYWILTPENVELMVEYEDRIMEDVDWKRRFCYVGEDPQSTNYSCSPSVGSVARTIYELEDFSTMTADDIREWVLEHLDSYFFYFNEGVDEYEQIYRVRSFLYRGGPIATNWSISNGTWSKQSTLNDLSDDGGMGATSTYDDAEVIVGKWVSPIWSEITEDAAGEYIDGDLHIMFLEEWNLFEAIMGEFYTSFFFFAMAVLVVLLYMTFHLGSCFLSCGAMLQILLSFLLAYFFYGVLCGIDFLDFFSVLIIFVLLGIGADDVFVFTDAWSQSAHFVNSNKRGAGDQEKSGCCSDDDEDANIMRMSFTFRRAAKAMLTTQATTFFAFLATAASNLMHMKAFGYWAAMVIFADYILCITLYSSILMIHHRFIKQYEEALMKWTCCICCTLWSGNKKAESPEPAQDKKEENEPATLVRQLSEQEQAAEYRGIEQFLGRKWSKWIGNTAGYNLVFFAVLVICGFSLAFQLESDEENDMLQPMRDGHYVATLIDISSDFGASETDGLLDVTITFGLEGVDRSSVKTFDREYYGDIIWDVDFSMSSAEAQEYLWSVCEDLQNSSLVYDSPNSEFVRCPIYEFKEYLQSINESFPYEADGDDLSFAAMWYAFLDSDYAEETIEHRLSFAEEDGDDYVVRFYAMFIETPISSLADTSTQAEYRDDFDDEIDEIKEGCPDNLCASMCNASAYWSLLATMDEYVYSALRGIAIALPLAFVVLLISTRNWIVSIFAIMDIIGVIACELGMMWCMGWSFGVLESISVILVIGFSVDYVVHLANSYLESAAETRFERMSFALLTMGVSVVSGAATTMLAGIMLLFPNFILFYKMGWTIVTVVVLALLWSMVFFTSMVALCGPERDQGDLNKYLVCCRKEEEDISAQTEDGGKRKVELTINA